MNYWIDLFTGGTWDDFRRAGSRISGFNKRLRKNAARIRAGDVLLCYLTGVKRWVGALKVVGPSNDSTPIWRDAEFPVRFSVVPLVQLDAEFGVPMDELEGRVAFYRGPSDRGKFQGFVRLSPNLFKRSEDGALILELLERAQSKPIARPVDPRKLARKPFFKAEQRKGKTKVPLLVSVPDAEDSRENGICSDDLQDAEPTRHTEMQFKLLQLGTELGLDVWVARNDRRKTWRGKSLDNVPSLLNDLPMQFNEATNRTIELIDVLWLKENSFVAAFEIECTTSVYSGLLRMSDLLALQPNIQIRLYLVAPDERRAKVEQEIQRPTFKLRERPLPQTCGFLSFSKLQDKVDGIRQLGLVKSLKPDFLEATAEYFRDADG